MSKYVPPTFFTTMEAKLLARGFVHMDGEPEDGYRFLRPKDCDGKHRIMLCQELSNNRIRVNFVSDDGPWLTLKFDSADADPFSTVMAKYKVHNPRCPGCRLLWSCQV